MKTKIFFTALCLMAIIFESNAQLKVSSAGYVGVQVGTATPLSSFAVGDVGATDTKVSMVGTNSNTALKVQRLGSSTNINYGINVSTASNGGSPCYNFGLKSSSYSSSTLPNARTYGVFGLAGGGLYGNYGLFGQLASGYYGAAVVGLVSNTISDYTDVYLTEQFAGYFVGNVKSTNTMYATNFIQNSDKRYKKNIVDIDSKKSMDNIMLLNPVEYNFNQRYLKSHKDSTEIQLPVFDEKSQLFIKKHFGLIAQDLQKIYPDLVYEDADGYLSVEYTGLIPVLIQSIKELKAEIDAIKTTNGNSTPKKVGAVQTGLDETDALTYPVLDQNTPNPFNQSTTIGYYLPATTGTASIYVYDMNGVQLKSYSISERGKKNIITNGSEFNAGMYLYALIADGKVIDTKRMILTK